MLITKTSQYSGQTRTLEIPISEQEYQNLLAGKGHIQEICPHLSPSEREFLMTGMTDDEWDSMCKDIGAEIDDEGDIALSS